MSKKSNSRQWRQLAENLLRDAAELTIMSFTDGLDRSPHFLRRDDGHGSLVRLAWHIG